MRTEEVMRGKLAESHPASKPDQAFKPDNPLDDSSSIQGQRVLIRMHSILPRRLI